MNHGKRAMLFGLNAVWNIIAGTLAAVFLPLSWAIISVIVLAFSACASIYCMFVHLKRFLVDRHNLVQLSKLQSSITRATNALPTLFGAHREQK